MKELAISTQTYKQIPTLLLFPPASSMALLNVYSHFSVFRNTTINPSFLLHGYVPFFVILLPLRIYCLLSCLFGLIVSTFCSVKGRCKPTPINFSELRYVELGGEGCAMIDVAMQCHAFLRRSGTKKGCHVEEWRREDTRCKSTWCGERALVDTSWTFRRGSRGGGCWGVVYVA